MTTRIDMISKAINDCLSQDCSANGAKSIQEALEAIEPTVRELLTLAYKEKKVEGPIGMCGTSCEGDCETCNAYTVLLDEHFRHLCSECGDKKATTFNDYNEKGDLCTYCFCHLKEKERQMFLEDVQEETKCYTCGSLCTSYEVEGETYWLCEACYYGDEPEEIGYCGFSCDRQCIACGGGYDHNGEI